MVNDPPRILAYQVVTHFQGSGRASLGIVFKHLAPPRDSRICIYLNEYPRILENEGLQLGYLDVIFRADRSRSAKRAGCANAKQSS